MSPHSNSQPRHADGRFGQLPLGENTDTLVDRDSPEDPCLEAAEQFLAEHPEWDVADTVDGWNLNLGSAARQFLINQGHPDARVITAHESPSRAHDTVILHTPTSLPHAYMMRLDDTAYVGTGQVRASRLFMADTLAAIGRHADRHLPRPAGNPNATEKQLDQALADRDPTVRRAAAGHPNATAAQLDRALTDDRWGVRRTAVGHSNTTEAQINRAFDDEEAYVRAAVAKNPNATEKTLVRAAADEEIAVRLAAVRNPHATERVFLVAAMTGDPEVLKAIAEARTLQQTTTPTPPTGASRKPASR